MNNPEHQRTNPQRAIDEHARNVNAKRAIEEQCNTNNWGDRLRTGRPEDHYNTSRPSSPPLIKLGQGRDEPQEGDNRIELLFIFMVAAMLCGGAIMLILLLLGARP